MLVVQSNFEAKNVMAANLDEASRVNVKIVRFFSVVSLDAS